MKKFAWVILLTLCGIAVFAQEKNTPEEYVEMYYEIAVLKMHEYNIPASITLAQGILESGSGNSELSRQANNHFGIKCHAGWEGEGFYMDDDTENECFRVYESAEGSYADHSLFLTSRSRYDFIFDECASTDYKCWAKGLKKAGYATNPKYPDLLIGLVERYDLAKYDKMDPTNFIVTENTQTTTSVDTDTQQQEPISPESYVGIFKFNKKQAVKSNGRQLLDIAVLYNIPLEKMMFYNDMDEGDVLNEDQFIFLEKKRKKGFIDRYIVKRGETMWEISQKNGIQLNKLYAKNKIPLDMHAKPGEKLSLNKAVDTAPAYYSYEEVLTEKKKIEEQAQPNMPAPTPEIKEELPTDKPDIISPSIKTPSSSKKYEVKAGDTLYGISTRFGIPVEELIKINKLEGTAISIGQVLLVSPKK